jgi:hypothetical protein
MMTFDEKLNDTYSNFAAIDKPDYTRNKLNLYADFVELTSLFSNTNGVSFGDVFDRFFGTKNYSNNTQTSAEQRDEDEVFINEILIIIEERISLYGNNYPFTFKKSKLLVLKSDVTWRQKLYLSLLVSSKLNIFKEFKSDLTTEFETLSSFVLKNFLPLNSIVKEFGENTTYTGNTIQKISQLARDLGLEIEEDELDGISERNNKERGLDIIGWIPFEDNCKCKLIYLAQCACGKNAESKQHDTRRFENYLKFYKTKPQHIMFIPYSLINIRNKKFYHSDLIEKDFLIFERKRIISLFDEENKSNLPSMVRIVDGCIFFQQDIV